MREPLVGMAAMFLIGCGSNNSGDDGGDDGGDDAPNPASASSARS